MQPLAGFDRADSLERTYFTIDDRGHAIRVET
jgi:hypothetical protein